LYRQEIDAEYSEARTMEGNKARLWDKSLAIHVE